MPLNLAGIIEYGKTLVQSRALRHLVLVSGWIVLTALMATQGLSWAVDKSHELFKHRRHGEILAPEQSPVASGTENLTFASDSKLSQEEQGRLKQQLLEVRGRARFHLQATVFIFSNYYLSTMAFSLASALAAILLVFISKTGWTGANEYLVTLFLVTAATAVFYKAFPALFMQEQSVEANKQLYLRYVSLEDRLITYAATGAHPLVAVDSMNDSSKGNVQNAVQPAGGAGGGGTTTSLGGKAFILLIDQELARDDIPIGIDHSKAPIYDTAFQSPSATERG